MQILYDTEKEVKGMIKDFVKDGYGYLLQTDSRTEKIKEVKIVTVGRKYVTVRDSYERKFKEHATANYLIEHTQSGYTGRLFLTKEEAEEYMEIEKISLELHKVELYKYRKCSLEQLKEIKRILMEGGAIK